jgi:YHS domain-containing protein
MLQNLNNGIAAQGYDVAAFFNGEAIKGNENISSTYNDANWLFSSEQNKAKFDENPAAFVPQYGGFCSIAMSEGTQVNPNPKSFLIQDGKLYFFTRILFGIIDARRQWVKDPEGKKKLADEEWAKLNA